jgi:hypothetical protein
MPSKELSVRTPLRNKIRKSREELLKNKLKLDEKVIGLLVHSQGTMKGRSFAADIEATMNIR